MGKRGSGRDRAVKSSEPAEKDELAKWQGAVTERGGGVGRATAVV